MLFIVIFLTPLTSQTKSVCVPWRVFRFRATRYKSPRTSGRVVGVPCMAPPKQQPIPSLTPPEEPSIALSDNNPKTYRASNLQPP